MKGCDAFSIGMVARRSPRTSAHTHFLTASFVAAVLEKILRFSEHFFRRAETTFAASRLRHSRLAKCTEALRETCGIPHFALHDLRRTFSSGMAALGISQIVVEKLINHVSGGTLYPVAAIYNRYG